MQSIYLCGIDYSKLNETEKNIVDYIDRNAKNIENITTLQIANDLFISKTSVIDTCKKLGFTGFKDVKNFISKDLVNTRSKMINYSYNHQVAETFDYSNIVNCLQNSEQIIFVARGLTFSISDVFSSIWGAKGYNVYNSRSISLIDSQIYKYQQNRTLFVMSHSGNTPSILKVMRIAHNRGDKVILLTANPKSNAMKYASHHMIYPNTNYDVKLEYLNPRVEMYLIMSKLSSLL